MNKLKCFFVCVNVSLSLVWTSSLAAGDEPLKSNEVTIEGKSRERRELSRPGQSVVIRPTDETRFDFETQMKMDPSISMSSGNHPGTFSLPLFRGQDARSSHVFIDDMELQDPFSGFPMVDDIDLRAFGVLTIHKGFAPWNLAVTDSGGIVQFLSRKNQSLVSGGGSYGDTSGHSEWLKSGTVGQDLELGLYARNSGSRGDYKYYQDNGTVLNSSDDQIVRRDNNDRTSSQAFLQSNWTGDSFQTDAFFWNQSSEQGLSLDQSSGAGSARSSSQTGAGLARLRWTVGDGSAVGVEGGGFKASRDFSDPSLNIGYATKRRLKTQSIRERVFFESIQNILSTYVSLGHQNSITKMTSTYVSDSFSPKGSLNDGYLGFKFEPMFTHSFEVKTHVQRSSVSAQLADGTDIQSSSSQFVNSSSLGWLVRWNREWSFYLQGGRSARAPSLMERIGNGAEIEGAPGLSAEQTDAGELGIRFDSPFMERFFARIHFDIWTRQSSQIIRMAKISNTRWRPQNEGRERSVGAEARMDLGNDDEGLELAASWIKASHLDQGDLLVRRVPMWQTSSGVRYRIFDLVTLRTLNRFVGRMYDDSSNTRELGWTLTHDVSADYYEAKSHWSAGISLVNITNVMSVPVKDTVTGQGDGRMAYSGFNSEPLPGRSWVASLALRL